MHKKIFLLLATIALLLFVAVPSTLANTQSPIDTQSTSSDSGSEVSPTPEPNNPDGVDYVHPPAGAPAFYITSGTWNPRPGQPYHADGVYGFWNWSSFNTGRGQYNWSQLDQWVQVNLNSGYKTVGIAINTYVGRYSTPCSVMDQGVDAIPKYVQKGRDGVLGTSDDAIFLAEVPDGRNYDGCTNYGGPWYVPNYTNSFYRQEYNAFVHALADHLLNAPYKNHVGWVSIGTGKDGENIPVDNIDDDFLLKHITVPDWVNYEKNVMDMYADAFYDSSGFPRIQLTVQNAPYYRSPTERRDIASYANQKRIGISINNITSDFDFVVSCDDPNPVTSCAGIYDQAAQYNNNIPIQLETYGYMTGSENEFYVAMARALQFRADYIRLSGFWEYPNMDTATTRSIAQWTTKYLGRGFLPGQEEPPSIWARMREHRNPVYLNYARITSNSWPYVGNYEFFLNQRNLPTYQAITIPVTDDERITWTGSHSKPEYEERWHTNAHPYDAKLRKAGLFHLINYGREDFQGPVDPGWIARRTDQATGNVRFIFDAADRYFDQSTPTTYKAIITVTYLDTGVDKWYLEYDSVTGIKRAKPYAINDWTPEAGLALEGGLPTSGVLSPPVNSYITKTDSGKWKVATFLIDDGNFNNGLYGGNGDIAIDSRDPTTGNYDGDEYIHHVDVQKVTEFTEPVKTGVEGFVYVDMNENGARDPWEPGIHNATVKLDGVVDYQTTTTGSGYYKFDDAAEGQYTLSVSPPPGYEQLTPPSTVLYIPDGHMLRFDFKHPPIEMQTFLYLPVIQTP